MTEPVASPVMTEISQDASPDTTGTSQDASQVASETSQVASPDTTGTSQDASQVASETSQVASQVASPGAAGKSQGASPGAAGISPGESPDTTGISPVASPDTTGKSQDAGPGAAGTSKVASTNAEHILKTLQESLGHDDSMLNLIPDVYRSAKGGTGRDLIYTDRNSPTHSQRRSLTSESPSIQVMIEEFDKIIGDLTIKQFYLALSRNIQKNFELSGNKPDKNALLLRLRKNSLLLRLPPTWDYAKMGVAVDLTNCTKLHAFSNIKKCQTYDFNKQDMNDEYSTNCLVKMKDMKSENTENVKGIFKKYNSDKVAFTIFNQIIEIMNIIVSYPEEMKVFKYAPFNQNQIVEEINNLVTSFDFKKFIIQDFPFPYLNNFIQKLIKLNEKVVEFYTWLGGTDNDKKKNIDIQSYMYLVMGIVSGNGRNNLPLVSISDLRYIFSNSWIKIPLLIKEMQKLLPNHYNSQDTDFFIEKADTFKQHIKKINTILMDMDSRRRQPILPFLDNIIKYLQQKETRLYDQAISYGIKKMIDINMTFKGDDTDVLDKKIIELIQKLQNYTEGSIKNIVCIKFIALLLFIQKNISNPDMDTASLETLFHEAINILKTINSTEENNCISGLSKLKIYEFLKIICDIFNFISYNMSAAVVFDNAVADLYNSLNDVALRKSEWLKEGKIKNGAPITSGGEVVKNTERSIPNLIFIVKSLDTIIKTCADTHTQLQTIFNEFKDNLTYTSVTEEDIQKINAVIEYLKSKDNIMCRSTSGNEEEDKKKYIGSNADDVKQILDYLKRYSSPTYVKEGLISNLFTQSSSTSHTTNQVDVGEGGAGKKHRKRYIKNKQNNNKNNNITMKKNRRNRKRAPVMKTIRNKKEQE
jgi:hypothetical protein